MRTIRAVNVNWNGDGWNVNANSVSNSNRWNDGNRMFSRNCCVLSGRHVWRVFDSDAHSRDHFKMLEHGIAQARRGWAKRGDIINAWPVGKMLDFLK